MLRLRRKRQEMFARLKKITFEGRQNNSLAGKLNEGSTQEGEDFTINNFNNNLITTNNTENDGTLGYIDLETKEVTTNNFQEENNKTDKKVDLETFQEKNNEDTQLYLQQDLDFSYSLTNLPSFQRIFLPRDFGFLLILVYPCQIRYYIVQNKQISLHEVRSTRHCRNRKSRVAIL